MKWLDDEIDVRELERNAIGTTVRWRFDKDNASAHSGKVFPIFSLIKKHILLSH
jgi:hypothetical protein